MILPERPEERRAVAATIALFTAIEVLGVGAVGAWLALRLHFPYGALTPLSILIYAAAGYYGCRAGAAGWFAGGVVALADAIAWAAFGGVGPQPADPAMPLQAKAAAVAFVTVLGAVAGLVGARLHRRRNRAGAVPPT